jgi:N-acetylglucosaminyl-diphospho-decaprenol L-rhamnosyltransferase
MADQAGVEVDVVIPTWNRVDLLERCLRTLEAQTAPHRVIVADNGSTDGTAEALAERFPAVQVIAMGENRGFARAVNAGIAAGSAPHVVLINNDVECDPDFVERIVAPLRSDPHVGAVAGLLLVPGRREIDSYGIEVDATMSAFGRYMGAAYPQTPIDARHLAGPCGGAAAYRREALDQVGGFDETLFAYMEDVDLALRMRARGWSVAGAPDAIAIHLGSATFGGRTRWQVETAATSRGYMLRKYRVLARRPAVALWAAAIDGAALLVDAVISRELGAMRAFASGWRAAVGQRGELPAGAVNPEIGFVEGVRRRLHVLRGD